MKKRLAILATHPVQYFVPVFRGLEAIPWLRCQVFVGCLHGAVEPSYDPDFGLTFAWDCDLCSGYNRTALTHWPLQALSGWRGVVAGLWAGLKLALWRPDAVLIYAYSPSFITTASLVLAVVQIPILLRADTSDEAYSRSALRSWIRDQLLRIYYRSCKLIFPIGAESHRHFMRLGVPPAKLNCVPYAVDQRVFPPLSGACAQPNADAPLRLGFVGKFTLLKDPMLMARALNYLSDGERTQLRFAAAGDGPLLEKCRKAMKRLLSEVCFHGFLNQSELNHFYGQLDVLILPSVQGEVWGLVINEALSQGVRVIVSNRVSCRHDLVLSEQAGWVFPAGQARALARALRLALMSWPWPREPQPTPVPDLLVAAVGRAML